MFNGEEYNADEIGCISCFIGLIILLGAGAIAFGYVKLVLFLLSSAQ